MTIGEWEPSPDQETALDMLQSWWTDKCPEKLMTLGGYAGSGKSTLVSRFSQSLRESNEDIKISFTAPTGRAAIVLSNYLDAAGIDGSASTIHSLIYRARVDEKTGRVLGWGKTRSIDADLLIVDESSMISEEVFEDLRSFGVPILAVGDHGQLPPVEGSFNLMEDPKIRLDRIHRQAKDSPILRFSSLVRNGAPLEALKRFADEHGNGLIQFGNRNRGIEHGSNGLLLSHTNRFRVGLNREIRYERYGYDDCTDPQPDETVICLRNQRAEGGLFIANGCRGTIKSCELKKDSYLMDIQFEDESTGLVEGLRANPHQFDREATFSGFDEIPGEHADWTSVGALMDFGYAVTCHKAQGSQAENVSVFLESSLDYMEEQMRKRWLYTAVTRASKSLMLIEA